jgi:hypothetical protein
MMELALVRIMSYICEIIGALYERISWAHFSAWPHTMVLLSQLTSGGSTNKDASFKESPPHSGRQGMLSTKDHN